MARIIRSRRSASRQVMPISAAKRRASARSLWPLSRAMPAKSGASARRALGQVQRAGQRRACRRRHRGRAGVAGQSQRHLAERGEDVPGIVWQGSRIRPPGAAFQRKFARKVGHLEHRQRRRRWRQEARREQHRAAVTCCGRVTAIGSPARDQRRPRRRQRPAPPRASAAWRPRRHRAGSAGRSVKSRRASGAKSVEKQ